MREPAKFRIDLEGKALSTQIDRYNRALHLISSRFNETVIAMDFLLALFLMQAPGDLLRQGAKVFKQSCAVGYCHGSGGQANRAPALAGREFSSEYVMTITRQGKKGTAMPAFEGKLTGGDINAVVAYVMSLSGKSMAPAASVEKQGSDPIPVAAKTQHPGRALFFDASRMPYCGTCHRVENWGTAVGPNLLASAPANGAAIAQAAAANVQNANMNGDRFPALVVQRADGFVKLYDLTGPLPVLRTVAEGDLRLESGKWSHSQAVRNYTAPELDQIAGFLKEAGQ